MKIQVYRSKSGKREWFWRAVARNGRIVADGGEGYSSRARAWNGFRATLRIFNTVKDVSMEVAA